MKKEIIEGLDYMMHVTINTKGTCRVLVMPDGLYDAQTNHKVYQFDKRYTEDEIRKAMKSLYKEKTVYVTKKARFARFPKNPDAAIVVTKD